MAPGPRHTAITAGTRKQVYGFCILFQVEGNLAARAENHTDSLTLLGLCCVVKTSALIKYCKGVKTIFYG